MSVKLLSHPKKLLLLTGGATAVLLYRWYSSSRRRKSLINNSADSSVVSIQYRSLPTLTSLYLLAFLGIFKSKLISPRNRHLLKSLKASVTNVCICSKNVEDFITVLSETDITEESASRTAASTDLLPIGYLQALFFPLTIAVMTSSSFPLNVLGSVHESNHITQYRGISRSERLDATTLLYPEFEISDKGDQTFTLKTTVTSNSEIVYQSIAKIRILNPRRGITLTQTLTQTHQLGGEKKASLGVDPNGEDGLFRRLMPKSSWQYPVDIGRKYARVNGDKNPIHMYKLTAMLFGYKSCISHGMFSVNKVLNEVLRRDSSFLEGKEYGETAICVDAEFVRPLILPQSTVDAFIRSYKTKLEDGSGGTKTVCFYSVQHSTTKGNMREVVRGSVSKLS